jgi:hypothetical protein
VKRTRPLVLVLWAVIGAAFGWLLQTGLASVGAGVLILPISLGITLAVIGAVVIFLAVPVRRAVRERKTHRVDPFYATRVVVLAKAASIFGSLLFGASLGILVYLLTRTTVSGVGSIFTSVAAVVGAVILLVCGLVGEGMCSIPPEDKNDGDEKPATLHDR